MFVKVVGMGDSNQKDHTMPKHLNPPALAVGSVKTVTVSRMTVKPARQAGAS